MKLLQENIGYIYDTISNIFSLNFIIKYNDNRIVRLNELELSNEIKDDEIKMINELNDKNLLKNRDTICYYESKRKLKYMVFSVYDEDVYEGNIILGPYLNYPLQLNITLEEGKQLDKVIPIIKILQEKSIENIINSMMDSGIKDTSVIFVHEEKKDKDAEFYHIKDFNMSIVNIRERYKIENKLLHYVSAGDKENAFKVTGHKNLNDINRFPDNPIRNIKNFAITMNTLLRKAVQENNIEPYFLDSISEHFAKKIEKENNIDLLSGIFKEMISEYCNLVNDDIAKGYSKLVSNAINYIKLNFKYEIRLSSIAKELFVHPTYLAKKFKEETKKTVSEYINEVRVREAKIMLKNTEFKVEDIAYYVGYNDKKYFSKTFKKIYNQSPSDYRKYN